MIPIIRLKKEVEFNSDLKIIVDALKGIAMTRFHMLQRQLTVFERFPQLAGQLLAGIPMDQIDHPYVKVKVKRTVALLVTTDSGFMGGLNSQVVSTGVAEAGPDAHLVVIGERGLNYLSDSRKECDRFPGIQDRQRTQLASKIREHILPLILDGKCGRFIVVYPKPISLAVQKVTIETMLPCEGWLGSYTQTSGDEDMIWESEPRDVLSYVATFWVEHRLAEIFAMSQVAELGARVMHLEGSYQEVTRQGKKLKLQYHRARHEIIDRSMREVFSSQLLFNKLGEEAEKEAAQA